jgi:hypothetical protein
MVIPSELARLIGGAAPIAVFQATFVVLDAVHPGLKDVLPWLDYVPIHELMNITLLVLGLVFVAAGIAVVCTAGQHQHSRGALR